MQLGLWMLPSTSC